MNCMAGSFAKSGTKHSIDAQDVLRRLASTLDDQLADLEGLASLLRIVSRDCDLGEFHSDAINTIADRAHSMAQEAKETVEKLYLDCGYGERL